MMSRYATDAVLFLSSPQVIFQQRPLKTIYDLFQRSVRDGNFFFLFELEASRTFDLAVFFRQ